MFEDRVLRRIFGLKRDEMMERWGKLHNEELHDVHSSLSIIRIDQVKEDGMGEACSTNGEMIKVCYWCKSQREADC
jgi:hypothetical protein